MEFNLTNAIKILERTPQTLKSFLSGLSDDWIFQNEGKDTWSPYDIMGHLIGGEDADWISRCETILEHGESKTFAPFDRDSFKDKYKGKTIEELLDLFAEKREQNIETLRRWKLGHKKLALTGTHPELGQVTLSQLLATWVVHDLSHVRQVARVMAKQYKEAVGPWGAYLPVVTE